MQTKTLSNLVLEFPALEKSKGKALKGGSFGGYWNWKDGGYVWTGGNITCYGTSWHNDPYDVRNGSGNAGWDTNNVGGGSSGGGGGTIPAWMFSDRLSVPDVSVDPNSIHDWADSKTAAIGEALGFGFDLHDLNITTAQKIATKLGADLEGFRMLEGVGGIAGKFGYVGLAVDGVQTLSVLMKDEPWTKADYAQVLGGVAGATATILIATNPVTATVCAALAIGAQIYEWHVQ